MTADAGLDSRLFSLTNQDRASNGVGSTTHNGTLQNIGEGAHYNGCASGGINGRSVDMIQRGYFSHQIPPCNMYVFPIMRAFGINYRSAGENIGWETGSGDPAGYINTQFMNSPEHRANILNGNYTDLGVGSAFSGGANGCCGGNTNDWMFSEEFAQLSSPPPPPPPPPPPRPQPPRNSAPPRPPGQAPVSTTPAPTGTTAPAPSTPAATPLPTPTPLPAGVLPSSVPLLGLYHYQGLLPDSVESVLEAFLVD